MLYPVFYSACGGVGAIVYENIRGGSAEVKTLLQRIIAIFVVAAMVASLAPLSAYGSEGKSFQAADAVGLIRGDQAKDSFSETPAPSGKEYVWINVENGWKYNRFGLISSREYQHPGNMAHGAGTVIEKYSYDSKGRLKKWVYRHKGKRASRYITYYSKTFKYNRNGRLTSVTHYFKGKKCYTVRFSYSSNGRKVTAKCQLGIDRSISTVRLNEAGCITSEKIYNYSKHFKRYTSSGKGVNGYWKRDRSRTQLAAYSYGANGLHNRTRGDIWQYAKKLKGNRAYRYESSFAKGDGAGNQWFSLRKSDGRSGVYEKVAVPKKYAHAVRQQQLSNFNPMLIDYFNINGSVHF